MTEAVPVTSGPFQQGFTLLELIIAMTLLSLMLTLLFSGLRTATRAWESGVEHAEVVNELQVVRDWLRRYLSQARPVLLQTENRKKVVAFDGKPDEIRFVVPLPAHRGGGGLQLVRVAVERNGQHRQLVINYQLYHPDLGGFESSEEGEKTVLLDDIESADFLFYEGASARSEAHWNDTWQDMAHLPYLVRVEVQLPPESRVQWSPLVVAPMIDGGLRRPAGHESLFTRRFGSQR